MPVIEDERVSPTFVRIDPAGRVILSGPLDPVIAPPAAPKRVIATATAQPTEEDRFASRRAEVAYEERLTKSRRRSTWAFGLLLLSASVTALMASPVLRVTDVRVVGNSSIRTETLLSAAALVDTPSMLTLRAEDVEARVAALPMVDEVTVWKRWPDGITITVAERYAVATAPVTGGWAIIDQRGETLETRAARPSLPRLDDPVLNWMEVEPVQSGAVGTGAAPEMTDADRVSLLKVASHSSPRLRLLLDQVSMTDDGIRVTIRPELTEVEGRTRTQRILPVLFGQPDDLEAKFRALNTLLDERADIDFAEVTGIDLSVADQPVLLRTPVKTAEDLVPASDVPASGDPATGAPAGPVSQPVSGPVLRDATVAVAEPSNLGQ
jgi:hypothetical protein